MSIFQPLGLLTIVEALARASAHYSSRRHVWRPTWPVCPTRLWSGRRSTAGAPRSGTCSPPGRPSPPEKQWYRQSAEGACASHGHYAGIGGNDSVKVASEHLNNVTEVFSLDVVVCFDEDLSQDGLTNRIVFGVELVKAMKSVAVLQRELKQCHWFKQSLIHWC